MASLSGFGNRVMLGICPEKTIIQKDTCTPMLTAVLLTWKQPICPSTKEWIKKMWCIYTMEYYSAIKQNAFELVLMRWMNIETVIQSEVRKRKVNITY